MAIEKIRHVHKDRGRYYYRRKVPIEFQDSIGAKQWRVPVGVDYSAAVRQVLELTDEHDALLRRLQNPEHRRDHKSKERRAREVQQAVQEDNSSDAYRQWLISRDEADPAFFGEDETSLALSEQVRTRPWESATRLVAGLELERKVQPDPPGLTELLASLERHDGALSLPPFPTISKPLQAPASASEPLSSSSRACLRRWTTTNFTIDCLT
jgi:hypothetical protein